MALCMQLGRFIEDRIGSYPYLDRKRRDTLRNASSVNQRERQMRLNNAALNRLWFAVVRWGLRNDLAKTLPSGLELTALLPEADGSRFMDGLSITSNVAVPARLQCALLDRLLSSYDEQRTAAWPVADTVLNVCAEQQPGIAELYGDGDLLEHARAQFHATYDAIKVELPKAVLAAADLRSWLQTWRLHICGPKVCCYQHILSIQVCPHAVSSWAAA